MLFSLYILLFRLILLRNIYTLFFFSFSFLLPFCSPKCIFVIPLKSIEKLPEVLIGDDKKIYKIMLIGGDNKKQLEKISGLAGISLSKAKKYLPNFVSFFIYFCIIIF